MNCIKNITFSAGSMGGLTFVGAWQALEAAGLTAEIINFSGCSIGSIMALLVVIGYTGDDLEALALEFRYKDVAEFQVLYAFENLGLETGNGIEHLLRELLYYKIGQHDITFDRLRIITGRNLWVNASCVEQDIPYYFSPSRTPNMSVIKAVRMSISLPVIMTPVKYNGLTFIDGGFHDPCPVSMFPPEDTLALRVRNDHTPGDDEYEFIRYIGLLMRSVYRRLHTGTNNNITAYRMVWLDSGIGGLTLNVKQSVRRKLVQFGRKKLTCYLKHPHDNEL